VANERDSFLVFTGVASVLSAVLAIGCLVLGAIAAQGNMAAFDDPGAFVSVGSQAAPLVYWSVILDLFGYYLLLVPALYLTCEWVSDSTPRASRILLWCGSTYVVVGAAGAAVLAATWPSLIDRFERVPAERVEIERLFRFISDVVYGGLWNRLEVTVAAVFWCGIAVLFRPQRPAFAGFSLVLGLACAVDAIGNIFHAPLVASIGLDVYLIAAPAWAVWVGVLALASRAAGPRPKAHGSSRRCSVR